MSPWCAQVSPQWPPSVPSVPQGPLVSPQCPPSVPCVPPVSPVSPQGPPRVPTVSPSILSLSRHPPVQAEGPIWDEGEVEPRWPGHSGVLLRPWEVRGHPQRWGAAAQATQGEQPLLCVCCPSASTACPRTPLRPHVEPPKPSPGLVPLSGVSRSQGRPDVGSWKGRVSSQC